MRFHITSAFGCLVSLVAAQSNPFTFPVASSRLTAGETATLRWTATTPGTVTLMLRSGNANDLTTGVSITQQLPNVGTFEWYVDSSITAGESYTLEIICDQATVATNYSPFFAIDSTNTVPSATNAGISATMLSPTASGSSTMRTSTSASRTQSTLGAGITTSALPSMATAHNSADVARVQSGLGFVAALAGLVAML